jgi:hypothetical protein
MRYYLPHPRAKRLSGYSNIVRSNFVSLAFSPPPAVFALLQAVWAERSPLLFYHIMKRMRVGRHRTKSTPIQV